MLQRLEMLMGARILQGWGEHAHSDTVGLRLCISPKIPAVAGAAAATP